MGKTTCFTLYTSDGSNYVKSSMFDRSKPKMGCLSSILIDEHVRVCSMFEKMMFESVR